MKSFGKKKKKPRSAYARTVLRESVIQSRVAALGGKVSNARKYKVKKI